MNLPHLLRGLRLKSVVFRIVRAHRAYLEREQFVAVVNSIFRASVQDCSRPLVQVALTGRLQLQAFLHCHLKMARNPPCHRVTRMCVSFFYFDSRLDKTRQEMDVEAKNDLLVSGDLGFLTRTVRVLEVDLEFLPGQTFYVPPCILLRAVSDLLWETAHFVPYLPTVTGS